MLQALAILFFGLCAFDSVFTRRRMRLFGLNVELNSLIKNTCALCGIELGVFLTMLLPAAALTFLLYKTHFEVGLALLIGFRARLSYIQIQSLKFEKQIREFQATLNSGAVKKSAPPSARPIPDKDTVAQPPSILANPVCPQCGYRFKLQDYNGTSHFWSQGNYECVDCHAVVHPIEEVKC